VSVGLAIFVKTPGLSPVKTRLAAAIGPDAAEIAYWSCVAAVVESVTIACDADADLHPYFAVAEAEVAPAWQGLPTLAQGEGGLGARMARVHADLVTRHGAGVLIGADAPQVTPALLRQAAAWARSPEPRIAFGPAQDGGFWLIGANRVLPDAGWLGVAYSRADTGERFRLAMSAHGHWLDLPTLTDFDRVEDATQLAAELASVPAATESQARLARWLARSGHFRSPA